MAKIKDPILFSKHYGLEKLALEKKGVLDPVLNVDTKLFIDPMLLETSKHPEMQAAHTTITEFFELIIKLLSNSKGEGDLPWKTAFKKFLFHEISGTCIGYGAGIGGSGWGRVKAKKTMNTAKEIIDLGIKDPELFIAIPLLEENIGPDLISDMVTNIVIENIIEFNARVLKDLKIKGEEFNIKGLKCRLAENATTNKKSPVFLLPLDILRDLPIANDWEEVCTVASENQLLRDQVSGLIGEIWRTKSKRQKSDIREKALSSKQAFMALLKTIQSVEPKAYDVDKDPDGLRSWIDIHENIATEFPLALSKPKAENINSLTELTEKIIEQYTWLIEERGLSRLLWVEKNKKRVHESVAQMLFFAVADCYAKANNIDITPEADIGRGAVDFKFSSGYEARVLVEIKFSDHGYVVSGYEKQLEIYKSAERTNAGFYVVIDVGHMGTKDDQLLALKSESIKERGSASEVVFINGEVKPSASKVH